MPPQLSHRRPNKVPTTRKDGPPAKSRYERPPSQHRADKVWSANRLRYDSAVARGEAGPQVVRMHLIAGLTVRRGPRRCRVRGSGPRRGLTGRKRPVERVTHAKQYQAADTRSSRSHHAVGDRGFDKKPNAPCGGEESDD
jgi:hypothetical protein